MKLTELTPGQQSFAEAHHNLVYSYLGVKCLPTDEYYDVVIFGFLRAVQKYFKRPELRRYAFSTIAWKAMDTELYNYRKKFKRIKRSGKTVSFDSGTLHEAIASAEKLNETLSLIFVWHELAASVNRKQIAILRMKAAGYTLKEIARKRKISSRSVSRQIAVARSAARELGLI